MWPTTTLTPSDLPRSIRGRPLASAGVCGGCYSVSYSPAKGAVAVSIVVHASGRILVAVPLLSEVDLLLIKR